MRLKISSEPHPLPSETKSLHIDSAKIRSSKHKWGYIAVLIPTQHREKKLVSVTEIFVVSKEEEHQSLHCIYELPPTFYAVTFPVIITENTSPPQEQHVIISSPMVVRPEKKHLSVTNVVGMVTNQCGRDGNSPGDVPDHLRNSSKVSQGPGWCTCFPSY